VSIAQPIGLAHIHFGSPIDVTATGTYRQVDMVREPSIASVGRQARSTVSMGLNQTALGDFANGARFHSRTPASRPYLNSIHNSYSHTLAANSIAVSPDLTPTR
jgi:hypothetical protein